MRICESFKIEIKIQHSYGRASMQVDAFFFIIFKIRIVPLNIEMRHKTNKLYANILKIHEFHGW